MHLIAATATACLAASGFNAPPLLEIVDADAKWIVHVDLEAATQTDLGRLLLEPDDGFDIEWGDDIAEFTTNLGIACGEDLYSLTAYGFGEDGAIVFFGNAKLDRWREHLLEEVKSTPQTITMDGRDFAALATPELDQFDILVHAGPAHRFWITSTTEGAATNALRVVLGLDPGLTEDTALLPPGGIAKGAIIYAGVNDLSQLEDFDPASEIAQQTKTVWITLGQTGPDAYIDATISAKSEEDATSVADLLRGFVALGRLTLGKDAETGPEFNALLDGMKFGSNGTQVNIKLTYDARAALTLAKKVE